MERISNSAQDVLIVAAISRLGRNGLPPGVHGLGHFIQVVFRRGLPFILTCVMGGAWGVLGASAGAPPVSVAPEVAGNLLYGPLGITTRTGSGLFLYGELFGQTPPIDLVLLSGGRIEHFFAFDGNTVKKQN